MPKNKRDYYDVLGIAREASPDEIKRAFRQAALKHHPDRNQNNPDAEAKFKEASEAYEVLSDVEKRQRYDRFGHAGLSGAGMHDFSHMGVQDIFSMFDDIFGGGVFGGRGRRGAGGVDLQTQVELSLAEVADGTTRTIDYERNDNCTTCGGSGAAPGSNRRTCPTCGGYGQVEQSGGLGAIFGRVITACPSCKGSGSLIVTPCNGCRGTGRMKKACKVQVKIPPGIEDGQGVRIPNEGEPGPDGAVRGNLYVYVRVAPHPFLERDGADLICRMPISFTQAALGAKVEVPTITGKIELAIPRGTQHGQVLRVSGQGLPSVRTQRPGNLLVQVLVEIPKKLSKKQEEILREFAETEDKAVLPESRSFLERLKDYISGSNHEQKQ